MTPMAGGSTSSSKSTLRKRGSSVGSSPCTPTTALVHGKSHTFSTPKAHSHQSSDAPGAHHSQRDGADPGLAFTGGAGQGFRALATYKGVGDPGGIRSL